MLACGLTVDALEVSVAVGAKVVEPMRQTGLRTPVAITQSETALVLVRSSPPLRPTLAAGSLISLRAAGTGVALPPTGHGRRMEYR